MKTENATTSQAFKTSSFSSAYPSGLCRIEDYKVATSTHDRARYRETVLLTKLRGLSDSGRAQVETFIDALSETEASESLRSFGASRKVFAQIWDNPADAEYNDL